MGNERERGPLKVRMLKGQGSYTLIHTGGGKASGVISEHKTRKSAERAFSKLTTGKNVTIPKGKKRRRYRLTEERGWEDFFDFDFL